ncbi:hypothetical protein GLI01_36090 [Gluconacetobacter liquefaciens]|nr:hypothetical protein AA0522_0672 [Gluconacetobacter liquefaciens NRIC 0522]GEB39574.1 hypothetical protein GLI01_36090 [Gluconacetobacter liquefaciens]
MMSDLTYTIASMQWAGTRTCMLTSLKIFIVNSSCIQYRSLNDMNGVAEVDPGWGAEPLV